MVFGSFAGAGPVAAVVLKLIMANGEALHLMRTTLAVTKAVSKVAESIGAAAGNRVLYFVDSMAFVIVMIAVQMSDVIAKAE